MGLRAQRLTQPSQTSRGLDSSVAIKRITRGGQHSN